MSSTLLTLPEPRTLRGFLRARRKVLGLTQHQLAKRVGVGQSKLSLLESGRQELTVSLLGKLAKALKVDAQTLLKFVVKQ